MSDDYGYFGKGTDGYIHYMQSFNASSNKGNGGGGKRPPSGCGCLTLIVGIIAVVMLVVVL